MKYNRLIMFCDYGLDDAIATMHILKHSDMFGKINIVPIGGNVSADKAFGNAQTLLYHANADKSKVRIVDTRAIPQCAEDIPDVHGKDGIGDVLEQKTSDLEVITFDGLCAEINAFPDAAHDCVLSLGPCTIPVMLDYVPFCTVLMGGRVNEQPNYGEYEFNEGCDTEAFKTLCYHATAVATLDTCHDKKFRFDELKLNDTLADAFVCKYVHMCRKRNAPVAVYDYVAALAVTDPELFDAERVRRPDGVEFNRLIYKGK